MICDKNVNLKIGTSCEDKVVELLRKNGYWVYHIPMKSGGQPIDIVALRGDPDRNILLDVKHVRTEECSFPLKRVEPNQWAALWYASEFAKIKTLGFAILFERTGIIYWLPYQTAMELNDASKKSINLKELTTFENIL